MTTNEQLELGFNGLPSRIGGRAASQRTTRAAWWFARMRAVVAEAMDWPADTVPRPEQIWMPGANRHVKL